MNTKLDGICPLCKERFDSAELHAHIAAERRHIVEYTLKLIKAMHPEWHGEDGVCQRCWEFYDALSRLVSFYEEPAPANLVEVGANGSVDKNGDREETQEAATDALAHFR